MVTIALLALLAQAPVITGDRTIVSQCEVSDDAEYGYTKDTPIRVGGLPIYGASRQQRYLRALVGPAGQPITFKRRGSLAPNRDGVIIDLYEVTYAGLDKPIELYLDFYRWDPPKAPRGFLCGTPIGLAPPPPDPKAQWVQLVGLAIRTSEAGDVAPIPLSPDGSTRYGVVIDAFRFVAGSARMLAAGGARVSAEQLAASISSGQYLVMAYELTCDGASRRPKDVELIGPRNQVLKPRGLMDTKALRKMLPWLTVPDGALGATFPGNHPPPGGSVRVSYDGIACPGTGPSALLAFKAGPPVKIVDAKPVWPEGVPVPTAGEVVRVEVRAGLDVEGVPVNLEVRSGPPAFAESALAAVRQWRYEPFTINGAPAYAPIVMTVVVTFSRGQGGSAR